MSTTSNTPQVTEIPILDYRLIETGHRDQFLSQLRYAFVVVGFCYLKHPPVDKAVTERLVQYIPRLFALPQDQKDAIAMVNSPHFLGYTNVGTEYTRGALDLREQFDFGTPYECRWRPGDPDHKKLWGDNQWPEETSIPGFKETLITYQEQLGKFSFEIISLLAEALGLAPDAFDKFYVSPKENTQNRSKIVKYPVLDSAKGNQGVGPHYDSGFLTLLLQASDHPGLQVQSPSGEWIDAKPLPDTLVVNLGKGIETATSGVARATCHRVLSPDPAYGPRYSVPFFQIISQEVFLDKLRVYEDGKPLPPEVDELVRLRGKLNDTDAVNYTEYGHEISGVVALIGRIKSHRDVAERHYPELYKQIFGSGENVSLDVY